MNFCFNIFHNRIKSNGVFSWLIAGSVLAFGALGCEVYDAPPEVQLVRPADGAFVVGDQVKLTFSEPIHAESLAVRLWPSDRGTRRVPTKQVEPLVDLCTMKSSPCGDVALEVSDDQLEAYVTLSGEIARAGAVLILEVFEGLEDSGGVATGVSRYFTIQFRASAGENTEDVEFDNGIYILGGSVTEPVSAILTLVTDVKVLPDGRMVLAAAKGQVNEGVEDRTTRDPKLIHVDERDMGFTLYATGQVLLQEDGTRFMETDPFEVRLPIAGFEIILREVRAFGEITKDSRGNDHINGTLSYEKLTFGNSDFDGDTASFVWDKVAAEDIPEGHPVLCEDLCGAIRGICEPPEGFPPSDFCE